jgi:hypothetical protein
MRSLPRLLVIVTSMALLASASSGDRSEDFQECIRRCDDNVCQPSTLHPPKFSPSLSLRITRWRCQDDCKYTCMHAITDEDIVKGIPIQQYYGKWPFYRFAGMQEPASVAFSLLNLWFHVQGWQKLRKRIPDGHPMKSCYLTWSLVSINAWLWSSVFHTRGQ